MAIVVALSLQNCTEGADCGGPFCIVPPGGGPEATRLRAGSGNGQTGAPGRELPQPLVVVVTDDDDRPIPDVEVSFTAVGSGGTISQPAMLSDHLGRVQVKWTLGAEPGAQTVQAAAADSSGAPLSGSPLTFSAQAVRSPPTRVLLLQSPPAIAQNGILFERHPVVAVLDSDNQPVAQVGVTVSIASGVGLLTGTATIATDAAGRATYSDLSILGAAGPRTLRFSISDPALEIVSGPVEVRAGTATTLLGNGPLTYQGTVHSPVSPAPSVIVQDESGNPVPGVTITFGANRDGSVSPATVTTNELGVAQVTSWTLGRSAGVQYSLTARIQSGGDDPVTFSATARAGAAGKLQIEVQPSPTAQSGVPFSRQPVIQVQDDLGNPSPQPDLVITATVSSGPGGTLRNASATTNSSGQATFGGLSLTGLAGDYKLSFSAPTLAGMPSDPISVGAGPPSQLALIVPPSPAARSRAPLGTQPSIQLQDASGNSIGQAGVEIRASIASGEGTLAGQTSAVTDGQGRADYADLAIVGSPGARTLRFASTSPASEVLSATITLPSVTAVSVSPTPPSSAVVGTRLTTPVSWTLTDAGGQPVADAPVVISVSAGGSVEPVSASDANGVVQLAAWTVSQTAGPQYVNIEVVGTQLSSQVTVEAIPDAAVRLQKISGDGQSTPVNEDLPEPLVVRVVDQYGNGVGGVVVQWRTCDDIGDYDPTTDLHGYSSAFQPTQAPGEFCTKASSSGLVDSPVQFTYTVTPGPDPSPAPSGQLRAKPPAATRQHQRP